MDISVYDAPGGSWQLVMGLFGMASGGVLGSGWGAGFPHLVTFANSDFIIASIGEELGLTGTLAVLMLYLLLIERGLRTAMRLRDGFGKLLAVGLSFTIAIQVFVVVGGVTRLIPLTGLTMPFIAYGGSSLVANWMILALLIRLSDAARRPSTTAPRFVDTAELPTGIRKHVLDAGTESTNGADSNPTVATTPVTGSAAPPAPEGAPAPTAPPGPPAPGPGPSSGIPDAAPGRVMLPEHPAPSGYPDPPGPPPGDPFATTVIDAEEEQA